MNKASILFIGLAFLSCNQTEDTISETTEAIEETLLDTAPEESFDWIIGEWEQINDDKEKKTYENWIKESNERYLGHGFVMLDADTLWQEKMVLSYTDSNWTLEVNTPGNDDLVSFGMIQYNSETFTVENEEHDFPQFIKYWKNLDKLNAVITGDDKEVFFEFKRLK